MTSDSLIVPIDEENVNMELKSENTEPNEKEITQIEVEQTDVKLDESEA